MEPRQLCYFARIVETGSMGSAALDLNIGVPALSQQMSRLENELVIRLPQYISQDVTPTSAGLAFYSQAQLAFCRAGDAILVACGSRLSGRVSVDMAPSIASVLGVPFINAMRESYSDIRLYMAESLSGNLEQMINTRQIDLAIVFQKKKVLCQSAIPILEERLSLTGAHALLAGIADDNIAPARLASIPLIMPGPGHGPCGRLEAICQEHALNIEIATETDGLALLMRVVRSDIGTALQLDTAIPHLDEEMLRVIGIHNLILGRLDFLVNLSDDRLTPTGLAARVVLTKVMHQLVEVGSWPGVILHSD